MKKRILSIVLTLVLLVSTLPISAIAAVLPAGMSAAPAAATEYSIIVDKGTASVNDVTVTTAPAGATVALYPEHNTDEQLFNHWEVVRGNVTLDDPTYFDATFTMPARDVHVKAVFDIAISMVHISDLAMPVVGEHPDYEVTLPKDAPYHLASAQELKDQNFVHLDRNRNGVWWKAEGAPDPMSPDAVFTEGAYSAQVVLIPEDGCAFTIPIGATINGKSELVDSTFGERGWNSVSSVLLTAFSLTPEAYALAVENGTASVNGSPVTETPSGSAVTLTAAPAPEGQIFDHWEVVSGNVTLANANAETTTFTMPAGPVRVRAVYTRLVQEITSVAITGLTLPVQGEHPNFEVTLPQDAPYRLATEQELSDNGVSTSPGNYHGMWWKISSAETAMSPDMTFAPDLTYYAHIVLMPREGYRFSETVEVTINGDTTLVGAALNFDSALSILTPYMDAASAPVTEYGIAVENGTASVDGSNVTTAPAGATVKLTAGPAPEGQIFARWEVVSGNIPLADANSPVTTFTMPDHAVQVKVVFQARPSLKQDIPLEFVKDGLFGQRVIQRTVPVNGRAEAPTVGTILLPDQCWLSEDESTVLFSAESIRYEQAAALQSTSADADGVVRFHSVPMEDLPLNHEITVIFMEQSMEVARTSITARMRTQSVTCAQALSALPDGYVFLTTQAQHVEDDTVSFLVAPIAEQTSEYLTLTVKLGFFSPWRLDGGKKSITYSLSEGTSILLPTAQKRNGTESDVLWSKGEVELLSGDVLSYEDLAQILSTLPRASDKLVLQGKIVRT